MTETDILSKSMEHQSCGTPVKDIKRYTRNWNNEKTDENREMES